MRISKNDKIVKMNSILAELVHGTPYTNKELAAGYQCSERLISECRKLFATGIYHIETNTNTNTNKIPKIRKIILPVTLPKDYQDHLIHALNKVAKDQKRRFKSEEIKKHLREAHIID